MSRRDAVARGVRDVLDFQKPPLRRAHGTCSTLRTAPTHPTYPLATTYNPQSYRGRVLLAGEDTGAPLGRLGELVPERGSEVLTTDEELFDPREWEETFYVGDMHPEWDLLPPPTIAESIPNVRIYWEEREGQGEEMQKTYDRWETSALGTILYFPTPRATYRQFDVHPEYS
jgi:hypothetical protein